MPPRKPRQQQNRKEREPVEQPSLFSRWANIIPPARMREIVGVILFLIGALTLMTLLRITRGTVSDLWASLLRTLFGWGAFALPLAAFGAGAYMVRRGENEQAKIAWGRVFAVEFFFAVLLALVHLLNPVTDAASSAQSGDGGGFVGYAISTALASVMGNLWAGVALAFLGLLALPGILGLSATQLHAWSDSLAERAEQTKPSRPGMRTTKTPVEPERVTKSVPTPVAEKTQPTKQPVVTKEPPEPVAPIRPTFGTKAPMKTSASPILTPHARSKRTAQKPPLEQILEQANEGKYTSDEAKRQGQIIIETLANFGIPIELLEEEIRVGPTITQFGLKPGFVQVRGNDGSIQQRKISVNRIVSLQHDLELALARAPIRIEAPVPGRPIVGVEVPNQMISVVSLRGVMESESFKKKKSSLKIALGRDVSGGGITADLASMPHLLIAGATGSGKSVCINAIIACLLFDNSPDELRMIMVDPKRVELVNFNGIPHLLGPVVVNNQEVVPCLRWLTREMDNRFTLFAKQKVRNIDSFNEKMKKENGDTMPFIVALIDELADLMLAAPEETEKALTRLAQMARATGIHLVIATQRPSVDVVTGLIKANFPSRISFAVTSSVDSRVVLDTPGAEKLLGKGDMLYMASDSSKLSRMQGCYVSDDELARLVQFWREKAVTDMRDIAQEAPWKNVSDAKEGSDDDLIEKATELVSQFDRTSISFLQRKLGIGYPRAARLMDQLEESGVVGPDEGGGKSRAVIVHHGMIRDFESEAEEPPKKKK
ncbi:MAG: DNA translocase FtsK 4TM domain-containing protein [Chloroflexi bacterium]|nr:DNA translocase FtsK 4TM domain-containing protein [Chloroflexota bacterium]